MTKPADALVRFRLLEPCDVGGRARKAGEVVSVALKEAADLSFLTRATPVDQADIPRIRAALADTMRRNNGVVRGVPSRSRPITN